MTAIYVTDSGFSPASDFAEKTAIECPVTEMPEKVLAQSSAAEIIIIDFASYHDGRGFSQARRLRELGYNGLIVATGALICDQYRHARQSGFDAIRLSEEQAQRMPEHHWLEQAQRIKTSYQHRLSRYQAA